MITTSLVALSFSVVYSKTKAASGGKAGSSMEQPFITFQLCYGDRSSGPRQLTVMPIG